MYYVLFNPKSGNVKEKSLLRLEKYFKKRNLNYKMLNYLDYSFEDIDVLTEKDFLVLAGGDGTINHFLSEEKRDKIKAKILLYKAGSGNDFAREHKGFLVDITEELKKAPYYLINDNKHYFINGVGWASTRLYVMQLIFIRMVVTLKPLLIFLKHLSPMSLKL